MSFEKEKTDQESQNNNKNKLLHTILVRNSQIYLRFKFSPPDFFFSKNIGIKPNTEKCAAKMVLARQARLRRHLDLTSTFMLPYCFNR
jgi:hypothetical protein